MSNLILHNLKKNIYIFLDRKDDSSGNKTTIV